MLEVGPQGGGGAAAQRDRPLFVSFAAADAIRFLEVQVVQLEVREFRSAAARGVEQFQERPVAPPAGVARPGHFEEAVDLGRREDLRHPFPQFLAAQQLGLALDQHALQLQIAKEDLQRGDVPGDARGVQAALVQPVDVIGQIADREPGHRPGLEPLEEPPCVAAVGGHGVVGQVAFPSRVGNERFQVRCRNRRRRRGAGPERFLGNEGHVVRFRPKARQSLGPSEEMNRRWDQLGSTDAGPPFRNLRSFAHRRARGTGTTGRLAVGVGSRARVVPREPGKRVLAAAGSGERESSNGD